MNIINITAPNAVHLTEEEATLLDLWQTCGLSLVLENAQQIEPILAYLQYSPEPQHGFAFYLGYPYYRLIERNLWCSAVLKLSRGDARTFMWMFRAVPYETVLKLLRAKLAGGHRELEYIPSEYNYNHLSFEANEAKWAKYCTMLALEGFPVRLSYRMSSAIDWLSSYEALQDRFVDYPLLLKMRKSLLRFGNQGHHDMVKLLGSKSSLSPSYTAGLRKYMNVRGLDRLAMMRQYTYNS